jgi:translation initiation factor 3 subunit E
LDQIAALYKLGRFQFTCGNYSGASEYLYHFRILSTDPELVLSANWGKLASDILSGKWDVALDELNTLRESLPSASHTDDAALAQLQSRCWILHWSLFVYFKHPQGRSLLLDTFLSPTYLNTIQASCPWIMRYLTSAAILARKTTTGTSVSSKARHSLKDIVKVIQMEEYQYSDPVTNFIKELHVNFDFENAQQELNKALQVISDDFFLNEFRDDFLDNARYLISEAYCRIHQRIDIR